MNKIRLLDWVYERRGSIQVPRSYGYAKYEHDEENGDTKFGPFRFHRIGGYEGPPWENIATLENGEWFVTS